MQALEDEIREAVALAEASSKLSRGRPSHLSLTSLFCFFRTAWPFGPVSLRFLAKSDQEAEKLADIELDGSPIQDVPSELDSGGPIDVDGKKLPRPESAAEEVLPGLLPQASPAGAAHEREDIEVEDGEEPMELGSPDSTPHLAIAEPSDEPQPSGLDVKVPVVIDVDAGTDPLDGPPVVASAAPGTTTSAPFGKMDVDAPALAPPLPPVLPSPVGGSSTLGLNMNGHSETPPGPRDPSPVWGFRHSTTSSLVPPSSTGTPVLQHAQPVLPKQPNVLENEDPGPVNVPATRLSGTPPSPAPRSLEPKASTVLAQEDSDTAIVRSRRLSGTPPSPASFESTGSTVLAKEAPIPVVVPAGRLSGTPPSPDVPVRPLSGTPPSPNVQIGRLSGTPPSPAPKPLEARLQAAPPLDRPNLKRRRSPELPTPAALPLAARIESASEDASHATPSRPQASPASSARRSSNTITSQASAAPESILRRLSAVTAPPGMDPQFEMPMRSPSPEPPVPPTPPVPPRSVPRAHSLRFEKDRRPSPFLDQTTRFAPPVASFSQPGATAGPSSAPIGTRLASGPSAPPMGRSASGVSDASDGAPALPQDEIVAHARRVLLRNTKPIHRLPPNPLTPPSPELEASRKDLPGYLEDQYYFALEACLSQEPIGRKLLLDFLLRCHLRDKGLVLKLSDLRVSILCGPGPLTVAEMRTRPGMRGLEDVLFEAQEWGMLFLWMADGSRVTESAQMFTGGDVNIELAKDWTPLGLIFRPLIVHLRTTVLVERTAPSVTFKTIHRFLHEAQIPIERLIPDALVNDKLAQSYVRQASSAGVSVLVVDQPPAFGLALHWWHPDEPLSAFSFDALAAEEGFPPTALSPRLGEVAPVGSPPAPTPPGLPLLARLEPTSSSPVSGTRAPPAGSSSTSPSLAPHLNAPHTAVGPNGDPSFNPPTGPRALRERVSMQDLVPLPASSSLTASPSGWQRPARWGGGNFEPLLKAMRKLHASGKDLIYLANIGTAMRAEDAHAYEGQLKKYMLEAAQAGVVEVVPDGNADRARLLPLWRMGPLPP